MLQDDNAMYNTTQLAETALMETQIHKQVMEEDLKQPMEIQSQIMKVVEELKTQIVNINFKLSQMNNNIEILQSETIKHGQPDKYCERKHIDKGKMVKYLSKREKGWKC